MSKRFKAVFLFTILILGISFPGFSLRQNPSSPQSCELEPLIEFEKFVAEQMAFERVPGLSIAFMKGDFTWAKGFGCSDIENLVPAKENSSYRLASITKTITAIAILQLVEAGKINLDAEVQTYVPYFPRKKWPVTIRQLLGHLGGISHYKSDILEGHLKEPKNTKQALAIFQDFDLVAEPGTKYNYSSYGFNLLGAVVEEVSGESYGNYIKKYIFEPLGMEDSRMDNPVDLIPNRVRGYRILNGELKNSEYVDVSSRFAGGGTRSTVIDLLKYAQGIMSGKLLKEETWQKVFSSMAASNGFFTDYGMGWMVRPWKGHFQVSHGGSQPETRTQLLIFPAEKFAVAAASNLEDINLMPYVKMLAELVLDKDLDSSAYAPDRTRQLIYNACEGTFSRGLSFFDWNGKVLSRNEKELEQAFIYFNDHVNEKTLQKDFREAKKKVVAGIHPAANQAFTQVGSFMAAALKEASGKENLHKYKKSGPIAFFSDYIKLSRTKPGHKKAFRFKSSLARLILNWERDWKTTYTDYVSRLHFFPNANFNEIEEILKKTFCGASLYADFSQDMLNAAQAFLDKNEPEKTFRILNLCRDLYPNSPVPYASLAAACIWTGKVEAAQEYYKTAFTFDDTHPLLSLDQFDALRGRLARAKKWKESIALGLIALDFYPKNTKLLVEMGNIYLQAGQKEKAVELFNRALEIDPSLENIKAKLKDLEKK